MQPELMQAIVDQSCTALPGLQRLVLFGSQASGQTTPGSDIDLLAVVASVPAAGPRTLVWRRALAKLRKPFDLLVLTPDEWAAGQRLAGSAVADAANHGQVLYAA